MGERIQLHVTFPNDGETPSQKQKRLDKYIDGLENIISYIPIETESVTVDTVTLTTLIHLKNPKPKILQEKIRQKLPDGPPYEVEVSKI